MPEALHPARVEREVDAYYLDRQLTIAEGTRQFSEDGRGREVSDERYYVAAIRRNGHPGWVFRFSHYDETAFRSIVRTLNRLSREQMPLA